jgi:hypothetical protein
LVRNYLLKVFDKYLERKKEYDNSGLIENLKEHLSSVFLSDIQRFQYFQPIEQARSCQLA